MATGFRTVLTNDRFATQTITREHSGGTVGNVTSAPTSSVIVAQNAGSLTEFYLSCGTNGVDATNPLSVTATVTNTTTATSMITTAPIIAKAAGTGAKNTLATATGITKTVLAAAASLVVAKGDVLKVVWTLTRTASPSTEIQDLGFKLIITENQDFNPSA